MKFSGVSSFWNVRTKFMLILVLVLVRKSSLLEFGAKSKDGKKLRGREGEGANPPICCFFVVVVVVFVFPIHAVPQTERLEQAISFFNLQKVFKLFKNSIALSYK